jgi:hypothetical protein
MVMPYGQKYFSLLEDEPFVQSNRLDIKSAAVCVGLR